MQDKNTYTINSTESFTIFVDDATDNKTGLTGLASELETNFVASKNGAAFVSIAPTVSEIGHGHYKVTPLAAHRDTAGTLNMRTTATGANSVEMQHRIIDPAQIIRDAIGMAAADLDSQLAGLPAGIEAALANDGDATAFLQIIADKLASDLTASDLTAQAVAAATRDAVLNRVVAGNHDTAGSVGKLLQFLDALVSSRSSHAAPSVPTAGQIRTELETDGGKLDHLWEMTEDDGGTRRLTMNALDQAGGGAGDATEAKQDQILGKLNSTPIKTVSNVSKGGEITIYVGDDDVDGNAILLAVTDTGEVLKAKLEAATSVLFGAGTGSAANDIVGTIDKSAITAADGTTTIKVEIPSANKPSTKVGEDYTYHIKAIDSEGNEHVEVEGCLELRNERATP